jgi:uncharacterized protein with PIN domain
VIDGLSSKLLVDGMLGRLAKWLRILGYDTEYEAHLDDNELVRRSRAEGRWLLTRDHELAGRPGVHSLLIDEDQLADQIRLVRAKLGPGTGRAFSRCPVCNATLAAISVQEVRDRVPPFVLQSHRRFHRCPSCDRVYWPGTHWKRMRELLARLEDQDKDPHPSNGPRADAGT